MNREAQHNKRTPFSSRRIGNMFFFAGFALGVALHFLDADAVVFILQHAPGGRHR
jgi:hypothetical protein